MALDPEQLCHEGCAAFNRGNYSDAIKKATRCIEATPADSYWYAAALELRCWAANFTDDQERVSRDANALLVLDTGDDKMWFDGLAVMNLALVRRRVGDVGQAETLFDQARAKFMSHRVAPQKEDKWRLRREFYEAVNYWAASGATDKLDNLSGRLSVAKNPSDEVAGIRQAVDLYQRHARGEDVSDEARRAADKGVSRAFLSALLIQ
jgi:tetratricopeptide (TPR) repeat protein